MGNILLKFQLNHLSRLGRKDSQTKMKIENNIAIKGTVNPIILEEENVLYLD